MKTSPAPAGLRFPTSRDFMRMAGLAVLYFALGRSGLALDPVGGFATLVWPPAGISLAALLIWGSRLWPGVALGAFLTNVAADAPIPAAMGIATGNTLEAVAGAWALRRIQGFRTALDRVRDVVALVIIGAGLATTISATFGVASLRLAGRIAPADVPLTLGTWWLGDAIAILILSPLLLVWASRPPGPIRPERVVEAAVLAASLFALGLFIFGGSPRGGTTAFWQPYMLSALLIWAAVRFEQRGAVTTIFIVALVAVLSTIQGKGPFGAGELVDRLLALQIFNAFIAVTFLVLGAVTAERERAERERADLLRRERNARDELQRTADSRARLMRGFGHDVKNPLGAADGQAALLESGIMGELNLGQRDGMARIRRSIHTALALIEDLLALARAEAGQLEVRRTPTDLEGVVREAAADYRAQAEAAGLRFDIALPAALPTPRTDPARIRQILANLISNAVKYTGRGGRVTIGASVGTPRHAPGPGTWVVIFVTDTGPGIPAERHEEIFDEFTRAAPGTGRDAGLGLAISRSIARLLGGDVTLESEVGRGSTFSLHVPVNAAARDLPRRPAP